MNEKLGMLQSSIQFIKEKIKSVDLFKTSIETRIGNLQGRYSILASSSSKNQKENLNGFDHLLSQSNIFVTSLKKVDTNSMANLKKLEQYFEEVIHEQQSSFLLIEQKMLGMFSQKQKILRNLTLEVDNHSHSIKAVQQWIKTDHNKGNSYIIMEENLKQRLEMIQKNNQMKINIIDQKIKYLQNMQESANNHRKKDKEEKENLDQELKAMRKDFRKKIDELQENLKEESKRKIESLQKKIQQFQIQIDKNINNANQFKTKSTLIYQDLQKKLNNQLKNMKQSIKSLKQQYENSNKRQSRSQQKQILHQYRQSRTQKRQNSSKQQTRQQQKKYTQNYQQQRDVAFASPISYDRNDRNNKNQTHIGRNQELYSRPQSKKQIQLSQKKPLPPKRNLFTSQSPPQVQDIPKEMSGGIRGLLQKSKQKEIQQLNKRSDTLSRQKGINKGLPPVRQDPFAKKKKNQGSRSKKQQSQQEQVVYEIDEQGYLMDQQGNYLVDQNGEMVRLSPQELQQYMNDEESYQQ